jgi:DNA-binding transcriptional MocR family regulator
MTPDELFTYAVKFCQEAEAAGQGTKYPTFRQVARRFKVNYDQIEQACEDWQGDAYMTPAVGFRSGSGYATFATRGEHLVEAYR